MVGMVFTHRVGDHMGMAWCHDGILTVLLSVDSLVNKMEDKDT
jgi:hypothetical protein